MRLFDMDHCQSFVTYGCYYASPVKSLIFKVTDDEGKQLYYEPIADIMGKTYNHNIDRINRALTKISDNYPAIIPIIEDLTIYMCPKPHISQINAHAYNRDITLYGRGTQIPIAMTDYIMIHELGHLVQAKFMDKRDQEALYREYLELRGAPKDTYNTYLGYDEKEQKGIWGDKYDFLEYSNNIQHHQNPWDQRPAEWFAEDFRYLFGIDQGDKFWGVSADKPDKKVREFLTNLPYRNREA